MRWPVGSVVQVASPQRSHDHLPDVRDQSLTELVRQLADEAKTLARQELELARVEAARAGQTIGALARQELQLAKAEMTEKGRQAGPGIGMVGAAGGIALLAAGALTACSILALADAIAPWLAALVVAIVYAVAAAGLYLMGKQRLEAAGSPLPEQTIETVKENIEWAKNQIASDSR